MRTTILENVESELELVAELLEMNPNAEGESTASKMWRYWDVWVSTAGGWQRLHTLGPLEDTRDNAIRIRDELKRQWQPTAQSRGGTLLVRCLTWSPVSNQWLECQNYSG